MLSSLSFGQKDISYEIDAVIERMGRNIIIRQTISLKNLPSEMGDTLYFTDWSNAYSTTKSPLAQRFVEEYDRSFFLTNKSKLGSTSISSITVNELETRWERLENQCDIIKVVGDFQKNATDSIVISLDYKLILPDAKFTGYGYNLTNEALLRNWYITLSPIYNKKWRNYSNLNLNDNSIQAAEYKLKIKAPNGITVQSNLKKNKSENGVNYFSSKSNREVLVYFTQNNPFQILKINNDRTLLTNIFRYPEDEDHSIDKAKRIDDFVTKAFDFRGENKFLIPVLVYDNNPFFGLNDLPKFLAPFNNSFLEEISFLKSYLHFYLSNNLTIDLRQDHWIIGGLQTYLMIKYIETYYPKEKYLGRLGDFRLMKAYTLADIDFNESFWMYYEFMERANLQQSDLLPKDQLVKFNEKIGSPYHVGVGLRYIEHYIGKESFDKALREYLNQDGKHFDLIALLKKHSPKNIDWFKGFYLKERTPTDIKIKGIKRNKDSIVVNLTKNSENNIPFLLSQVKGDVILEQQWIENMGTSSSVTLNNLNPDFIAINPEIRLPETDKNNNWRYIKNFLNLKPIQFNFFEGLSISKEKSILL